MRQLRNGIISMSGRELFLLAACVIAIIIFSVASPHYATTGNAATVLRNSVELLLVGLGMTLLLAMGGIDVSLGVVMGLAAFAVGRVIGAEGHPALALVAGPLVGGLLGVVTAAVVVLGRVPPIVGTLGLLGVYRTGIFLLLGGQWLSGLPSSLTEVLSVTVIGIPVTAIVIVLAYLAVWLVLRWTPFGLYILAVGNNEERARLAGIPVIRVRFMTFILAGILTGIAATFYISTYRNVEMSIGSTLALDAIAAVILGGTRILGGKCSLIGTILGVLLLRILQNGLLLMGVPSLWQPVVTGVLIIGVLGFEALSNKLLLVQFMRARA